jgi:LysM repeat protein
MQKTLFIALFAALLLSGCQTPYQSRTSTTRTAENRLIEQETQRRLNGRIETLEMEVARLSRELDAQRRGFENRCAAIERKSEEDKRELITRLSGQLEKLLVKAAPAAAPANTGGNAYGIEHVVLQGQTISTIAKAYNVTPKAIIDANKIKNPSLIRIGQKLFIPE